MWNKWSFLVVKFLLFQLVTFSVTLPHTSQDWQNDKRQLPKIKTWYSCTNILLQVFCDTVLMEQWHHCVLLTNLPDDFMPFQVPSSQHWNHLKQCLRSSFGWATSTAASTQWSTPAPVKSSSGLSLGSSSASVTKDGGSCAASMTRGGGQLSKGWRIRE